MCLWVCAGMSVSVTVSRGACVHDGLQTFSQYDKQMTILVPLDFIETVYNIYQDHSWLEAGLMAALATVRSIVPSLNIHCPHLDAQHSTCQDYPCMHLAYAVSVL